MSVVLLRALRAERSSIYIWGSVRSSEVKLQHYQMY